MEKGPGVSGVEQTYLTASKGQWMIVVQVGEIQRLLQYITQNLHNFYRHSKSVQPKLVTITNEGNPTTYKLALINKSLSRVGTYAEVLRRRFVPGLNDSKVQTDTSLHSTREHTHGDSSAAGIAPAYIGQKEVDPLPQTKGPSHQWPSKPLSSETKVPSRDLDGSDPMFVQGDETSHNTSDESVDTVNSDWDMTQIESRMQELKRETETMIKAVEDSIEKTIDAILDKKLKTVSIVVANAVTKRLMKAMDKKLSQTKLQDQTYSESINIPVTQQSPALTKKI